MEKTYHDVLVCVTGLTPQVVTETLYAMVQEARANTEAALPDEIRVVTTLEGRRRLVASLFSVDGGHGHFERLCAEYGLDTTAIRFDERCVSVIRSPRGEELSDIVDEADNTAAADTITAAVREATSEPSHRVHVSLAGGRKSMGFYAGYALSLYARPQDRLTHVLVNQPFESHSEFFYPPAQSVTLHSKRTNDSVSTVDARVRLANIPFVRLRDEVGESLLQSDLSFSDAVARAQLVLERPDLLIDLGQREVRLQGWPVRLSPTQFAWLTWFAGRAQRGAEPIAFEEEAAVELGEVIAWLEGSGPGRLAAGLDEAVAELRRSGEQNYFSRNRTRLNSALAAAVPASLRNRYVVEARGRRPRTQYALSLQPEAIRITGEP